MQFETSFEVPTPPDRTWEILLDVERIAPCMPGAQLTEVVDERTWKGKVNAKLGPVSLSYAGSVVIQEQDARARRAVLKAQGSETRGKGMANAMLTAQLHQTDAGGTRAMIVTDLTISGAVAQVARGMIGDVSQKLAGEFASCLSTMIAAEIETPAPGDSRASAPEGASAGAAGAIGTAGTDTPAAQGVSGGATGAPSAPPTSVRPPPPRPAASAVPGFRIAGWAMIRAFARLLIRIGEAILRRAPA